MPDIASFPITAATTDTDLFTIAGNHLTQFPPSQSFTITGSTGNDGTYTVISAALVSTNTTIHVSAVPDATADGTIYLPGSTPSLADLMSAFYSADATLTLNDAILATLGGVGVTTVNDALATYGTPLNDGLETEFGPGQLNDVMYAGMTP